MPKRLVALRQHGLQTPRADADFNGMAFLADQVVQVDEAADAEAQAMNIIADANAIADEDDGADAYAHAQVADAEPG